jgi:surface polysaccharide O-acyltransferase-like enzyme
MYQTPLDSTTNWWVASVFKSIALPCVPLFVMLSGALFLQSSKVNEPIRVFLKKRFNRIGLAFIFWSLIYLAWAFYVTNTELTLSNIFNGLVKGIFTGSYYHFWFLYLIVGLYLITPILRIVTTCGNRRLIRYLILLWFLGVAVVPIIQLIAGYDLPGVVFVIGGWVGYFVLGTYLQTVRLRPSTLYGLLFLGFILSLTGTWLLSFPLNSAGQPYLFFDYLSATVILASIALFMILSKFPADWPGSQHSKASRVLHAVSENTLPIYLFHIIILESLQRGFFGFQLSVTTLNPIVEIPLITVVTFFITFGLILVMKKVPVLKKLIG